MSPWKPIVTALLLTMAAGAPAAPVLASGDPPTDRPTASSSNRKSIALQVDDAARAESRASARSIGVKRGTKDEAKRSEQAGRTSAGPQDQTGQVSSGTAFNPAMSIIPDFAYYNDSRQGKGAGLVAEADGFHRGRAGQEGDAHASKLTPGFNLREIEVALSGSVDPYFDAQANLVIAGGAIEVEEAYVRIRRLPSGFQIKAGRFLSDIGYTNRQHPHQWTFADQNLAHDLVLGGGLGETGVQVTWLPSLPVYLQLGAEALQGDNAAIAAYEGPTAEHPLYSEAAGPRLVTGFAKFAPDLGFNHALQIGASIARARRYQEADGQACFEGTAWLLGLDAVYKHDSPKPYGEGDLVVQGEYLRRTKNLAALGGADARITGEPLGAVQDGIYVQGAYGIAARWTAALRFDMAGLANRFDFDGVALADYGVSSRFSASLTFDPTDFSRLRFQVDRAGVPVGGVRESFTQAYVQLQVSLGTHGAHKF